MALHVATRTSLHRQWIWELLCGQPSRDLSEASRVLTHLLTDDLVVETQIAGGGSADLSSSIWAKEKDITGLNDPKYLAVNKGNMRSLFKSGVQCFHFLHVLPLITSTKTTSSSTKQRFEWLKSFLLLAPGPSPHRWAHGCPGYAGQCSRSFCLCLQNKRVWRPRWPAGPTLPHREPGRWRYTFAVRETTGG